jgi:hypothetical protein
VGEGRVRLRIEVLGQPAFLFVNNRLEGNAPSTIEVVASTLGV